MNNNTLWSGKRFEEPLSNEEQKKYFNLAKQGNESAKEILLNHNLLLVVFVLNKYFFNLSEDLKEELFSVGCLELWKCLEKFDLKFNIEFSTYAIPSLLGSMKRYLRENRTLHIPRGISDLSFKITSFEDNNPNDYEFSDEELSKIFNVSEEDIRLARGVNLPVLSLKSTIVQKDDSEIKLEDTISDNNVTIYESFEQKELYDEIRKTINLLNDRERTIIRLLFGIDSIKKTQEEVSKILNISQATVCRTKSIVLKKLKYKLPKYIRDEYN